MESPIVRIVIIAASVAAAAGVAAIMWSVINTNSGGLDDASTLIPYESIESRSLCESVEDGAWVNQLKAGATINGKSHDDDDIWEDNGDCLDKEDLDSVKDGSAKTKPIDKKDAYVTGDAADWVLFNTDVR